MKSPRPPEYGTWKNGVAFIIGGGPSLLTTLPNPEVLRGRHVIVTNNAYKLLPWAHILHFADDVWWHWHRETIPEVFKGSHITTTAPGPNSRGTLWAGRGVTFIPKKQDRGLSTNKAVLHGSNAGHQAINLAYHMGASTAVLLGFDMNSKATQLHWHSEHRRKTNREAYDHVMLPGMKALAKEAEVAGLSIFNTNPDSAIRCFPFEPLERFL